jgi:hypothetical protein
VAALVVLVGCQEPGGLTGSGSTGGLTLVVQSSGATVVDSGQVIVQGPTSKTVRAAPGQSVTVDGLSPGTYTVTLVGFVADEVDRLGQATGVQVVAGQNASPTVNYASYQPTIAAPALSSDGQQITVSLTALIAADSYRVQLDSLDGNALSAVQTITNTSVSFPIAGRFGTYRIQARAFDHFQHTGRASADTTTVNVLGSEAARDGYVVNHSGNSADAFTSGLSVFMGDDDASSGQSNDVARGFYSFDLSTIPAGAAIGSAVLRLFQCSVTGAPYTTLGNVIADHIDYGTTLDGAEFDLGPLQANIGTLSPATPDVGFQTVTVTSSVAADVVALNPRSQFRTRFSVADGNNNGVDDFVRWSDAEGTCGTPDQLPQLILLYH